MKYLTKKILCILLAAALLLPVAALPASAAGEVPVVVVCGDQEITVRREDGSTYVPRAEYADEITSAAMSELAPLFAKSVLTGDYTEWAEKSLERLRPIYADIKPNPDGSLPEQSFIDNPWELGSSFDYEHPIDPGPSCIYYFIWDLRRSPLDVADDLQTYIDAIKARTGAEKVVLASRCAGTSVASAYLTKNGNADIAKVIYICNAIHGFAFADVALSGNVTVSARALQRFVQSNDILNSDMGKIYSFIMSTLQEMNKNASADDVLDMAMKIYDKIKDPFIAPLLREFWGISPGYVSEIEAHYDEYKDYIFPTQELKDEYAAIIAKTDEYHKTVQLHIDDLLRELNENGTPVYFIVSYGEQQYPVGPTCEYVGDMMECVQVQSFGATASKVDETLSDSYIAKRENDGLGRYISPDHQIDASTCMFPDHTWFVKNLRHMVGSESIARLLHAIANTENADVNNVYGGSDWRQYAQFLNATPDFEDLERAAAVNENDIPWAEYEEQNEPEGTTGFFARMLAFFAQIFSIFRSFINLIKTLFGIA